MDPTMSAAMMNTATAVQGRSRLLGSVVVKSDLSLSSSRFICTGAQFVM
jgi:hypothetical protein